MAVATIGAIPEQAWLPAYGTAGGLPQDAWVESTSVLDLSGWPGGMRVIIRNE